MSLARSKTVLKIFNCFRLLDFILHKNLSQYMPYMGISKPIIMLSINLLYTRLIISHLINTMGKLLNCLGAKRECNA